MPKTTKPKSEGPLYHLKVAVLCTDGVEQSELEEPMKALKEAGADVAIVSPKADVQAWKHSKPGKHFKADVILSEVDSEDYQALLLPGGVMNPDQLRIDENAVDFVRAFTDSGKPVAAICHGPWTLIEADAVRGKRLTSWPSLKTDLTNAGAVWEDASVVHDERLVTSRKPDDIPDFNREMISLFAEASLTGSVTSAQSAARQPRVEH